MFYITACKQYSVAYYTVRMTLVVTNWHLEGSVLKWWTMIPQQKGGKTVIPPTATKGRDYQNHEGYFVGNSVPVVSYQSYSDGLTRFVGADGKTYIAAFSTHYNNPRYPAQCISSKQHLAEQLALIGK